MPLTNLALHGDCFDLLPGIPDGSIDLVLADLPYGVTQAKWDDILPMDKLWEEYWRVLKPDGVIALTSIQPFTTRLIMSDIRNFKYCWYWQKSIATGPASSKYQPLRNIEEVCIFYKKFGIYNPQGLKELESIRYRVGRNAPSHGDVYGVMDKPTVQKVGNYPKQLLTFGSERGYHPTQKPVALFDYLIRTYTHEDMTVLDNAAGSGTTGVAAGHNKRKFVCIEKDDAYYATMKQRLESEGIEFSALWED